MACKYKIGVINYTYNCMLASSQPRTAAFTKRTRWKAPAFHSSCPAFP